MPKKCINRVQLLGNLVRDAETKTLPGGSAVTKFTIATTDRYKQGEEWKEETQFTNCVAWRMENIANFLTKGKQIILDGKLKTRNYDNKDGQKVYVTEVEARDIILLGGGSQEGESRPKNYKGGKYDNPEITDEDIPF